eukprot:6137345-Pleurochrysis_carterae.AAC.1
MCLCDCAIVRVYDCVFVRLCDCVLVRLCVCAIVRLCICARSRECVHVRELACISKSKIYSHRLRPSTLAERESKSKPVSIQQKQEEDARGRLKNACCDGFDISARTKVSAIIARHSKRSRVSSTPCELRLLQGDRFRQR